MAAKKYLPMFPIELVEKDFGYAEDLAGSSGIEAPIIKAVRAVYARTKEQGYGDDHIVGVAQLFSSADIS